MNTGYLIEQNAAEHCQLKFPEHSENSMLSSSSIKNDQSSLCLPANSASDDTNHIDMNINGNFFFVKKAQLIEE
jgi:hypothetical protein